MNSVVKARGIPGSHVPADPRHETRTAAPRARRPTSPAAPSLGIAAVEHQVAHLARVPDGVGEPDRAASDSPRTSHPSSPVASMTAAWSSTRPRGEVAHVPVGKAASPACHRGSGSAVVRSVSSAVDIGVELRWSATCCSNQRRGPRHSSHSVRYTVRRVRNRICCGTGPCTRPPYVARRERGRPTAGRQALNGGRPPTSVRNTRESRSLGTSLVPEAVVVAPSRWSRWIALLRGGEVTSHRR